MSRLKSIIDDRTLLSEEQTAKLHNAIWICKIGNFNLDEAMAFINSGELGYKKQTADDVKNQKLRPITVSLSTYYRNRRLIESPEHQTREVFKIFREEYVAEIISKFKLFKALEAKSIKALEEESNPHKRQLIINGIFRNSPYTLSLLDVIKQIVERNKMPFPKNPEVQKILVEKFELTS